MELLCYFAARAGVARGRKWKGNSARANQEIDVPVGAHSSQ
jgi:hypothetical protein